MPSILGSLQSSRFVSAQCTALEKLRNRRGTAKRKGHPTSSQKGHTSRPDPHFQDASQCHIRFQGLSTAGSLCTGTYANTNVLNWKSGEICTEGDV